VTATAGWRCILAEGCRGPREDRSRIGRGRENAPASVMFGSSKIAQGGSRLTKGDEVTKCRRMCVSTTSPVLRGRW
jgi:hypothetical protein